MILTKIDPNATIPVEFNGATFQMRSAVPVRVRELIRAAYVQNPVFIGGVVVKKCLAEWEGITDPNGVPLPFIKDEKGEIADDLFDALPQDLIDHLAAWGMERYFGSEAEKAQTKN
jgi:hypothetical protein